MTIKTATSLFKGNRLTPVEVEVASKSFPRKKILIPEKSKVNPIFHLPKSAKKLDGEESRTIILNRHKVVPSNCMPNISKVYVHTYFGEEFQIESSSVGEASILRMA